MSPTIYFDLGGVTLNIMLSKKFAVPRPLKNILTGEERQEAFIREERYELYVEQDTFRVFTAVPEQIHELTMGILLAGGIIKSREDVLSYRLCEMNRIYVLLHKKLGMEIKEAGSLYRWLEWDPAPSAGWTNPAPTCYMDEILRIDKEITAGLALPVYEIYYAVCYINENIKYVAWDTDEVNAVDKLAGSLIIEGLIPQGVLISNLRPRAEVLRRIRAVGIHTGVFSGTPTNAAHDYGINLISRIEGGYWVTEFCNNRCKNGG